MQFDRSSALARALPIVLAATLLLPFAATSKDKEYSTGKVLDAKYLDKRRCESSANKWECEYYLLVVQVDDVTYRAKYEQHGGLIGTSHYKFKEQDWPINAPVEVRFEKKSFMGLHKTFMHVKLPEGKGKEIELVLLNKLGPDGQQMKDN
jgi:hypothetical protein